VYFNLIGLILQKKYNMYRSHNCGELNIQNVGNEVILSGWVQKIRDKGGVIWIDLRDRFGITQIILEEGKVAQDLIATARTLGREYVLQVKGNVVERFSKNNQIATGDIEIIPSELNILNQAITPPFTIEDQTDGGEELRMKFRYLDIRRNPVKESLLLRHQLSIEARKFLDQNNFIEVETPYLIKSTPEGARDFVVPSRMNAGEFYALPQSPQTFKQLLMVAGMDRYYQIVKCFRDEDLRADRQPEFTQIDCELSFVEQEDILNIFEKMIQHLFSKVKQIELPSFPRMTFEDAMLKYGCDKPDLRFDMEFHELNILLKNKGFKVFDDAELVVGINYEGGAKFTRKEIDAFTEYVKSPKINATGLVYIRYNEDGSIKSSVDKFYSEEDLKLCLNEFNAKPGDIIFILAGKANATRKSLSDFRLFLCHSTGIQPKSEFAPLWVIDFPLLEWDEESNRFFAMHHPFTSPKKEDFELLNSNPAKVRANAYDMVINGVELGGGSIRIFDKSLQQKMFEILGFTEEEAKAQFGFLMNAFEYGAPPHGGLAFGFDRLCAVISGKDSIRDFIAFPKNNSGRDVMIDAPSILHDDQLKELHIKTNL
jgi:aspartyl-tRNA synthetase